MQEMYLKCNAVWLLEWIGMPVQEETDRLRSKIKLILLSKTATSFEPTIVVHDIRQCIP